MKNRKKQFIHSIILKLLKQLILLRRFTISLQVIYFLLSDWKFIFSFFIQLIFFNFFLILNIIRLLTFHFLFSKAFVAGELLRLTIKPFKKGNCFCDFIYRLIIFPFVIQRVCLFFDIIRSKELIAYLCVPLLLKLLVIIK